MRKRHKTLIGWNKGRSDLQLQLEGIHISWVRRRRDLPRSKNRQWFLLETPHRIDKRMTKMDFSQAIPFSKQEEQDVSSQQTSTNEDDCKTSFVQLQQLHCNLTHRKTGESKKPSLKYGNKRRSIHKNKIPLSGSPMATSEILGVKVKKKHTKVRN